MVVDTVYGLTIKIDKIQSILEYDSDLTSEDIEFYLNTIKIYSEEIDAIKDIFI